MRGGAALVLSTVPTRAAGERIARALVAGRLAACVSLLPPAVSIYTWRGKAETAKEYPLFIKTTHEAVPALRKTLLEIHPYDVPEFLVFPAGAGSSAYLSWIRESVSATGASTRRQGRPPGRRRPRTPR